MRKCCLLNIITLKTRFLAFNFSLSNRVRFLDRRVSCEGGEKKQRKYNIWAFSLAHRQQRSILSMRILMEKEIITFGASSKRWLWGKRYGKRGGGKKFHVKMSKRRYYFRLERCACVVCTIKRRITSEPVSLEGGANLCPEGAIKASSW